MYFLRIEFIYDTKNLEQDRLQKEQDKYVIASPGINCVTEACIDKLEAFDKILEKQPTKVY